ncbi:hypothetical protein DUNSADRAFT_8700 [Dunaliella salina]|uniref:C2 domain-containing protein n=1 Tax=Dunaliella salina TaxID=3046 RepID=A0ABQ7GIY3_DUNSA|nr:hypothetical protein DUNSADRAFT_8700 [Dunaliella salina]|eukprot:KAF5834575.1 hypothetical protein DUNSADRAFT_8700 [Dunaliella salina]
MYALAPQTISTACLPCNRIRCLLHPCLPNRATPLQRRASARITRGSEKDRRLPVARILPPKFPNFFQQSGQARQEEGKKGAPPSFSLPLAIALAGSAFEAYLEPTGAEGFRLHTWPIKSDVTFADSDFLSEFCQGILRVELQSAKGVRSADITGASDPYAVVTCGPSGVRSKVVNNTLNPEWNEVFLLYVRDASKDLLKVRLYDEDLLKSDDDLGLAMVSMAALEPGKPQDLNLELKGPGGGQGTVQLRCTLVRFSDHLLDKAVSNGTAIPTGEEAFASAASQAPQLAEAAAAVEVATTTPARQGAGNEAAKKDGGNEAAKTDAGDEAADEDAASKAKQEQQYYQDLLANLARIKDQVSAGLEGLRKQASEGDGEDEEKDDDVNNPWKVLAKTAGWASSQSWKPVAYVNNDETDSQAWLYRNVDTKEAVVAFRGTEQIKWKDLVTDLNLVPSSFNVERIEEDHGLARLIKAVSPATDITVHGGFLGAYDSIKPQIFMLLDAITESGSAEDPWRVYITGHSLGGALATLCAYELATRRGPARSRQRISMYSFGAPRAGNKVFAAAYNACVPDSWRITNSNDIIPTVPRLLGYAHVKHSVLLDKDGNFEIQESLDRDVFGEGRGGLDVLQELKDKIEKEGGKWEGVYEQIAAREMEILNTLTNGQALEEHMEDFYLEALQACVIAAANSSAATAADAFKSKKEK